MTPEKPWTLEQIKAYLDKASARMDRAEARHSQLLEELRRLTVEAISRDGTTVQRPLLVMRRCGMCQENFLRRYDHKGKIAETMCLECIQRIYNP